MAKGVEDALTAGLLAGYAGRSESYQEMRSVFEMNVSHLEAPDRKEVYHDEWIAGDRTGGGQELMKLPDGTKFTRLYAGGIISEDELSKLGIKGDQVVGFLKEALRQLGNQTRLFGDAVYASKDEKWKYSYTTPEVYKEVTQGREYIRYQDQLVFVHLFLLSPIE